MTDAGTVELRIPSLQSDTRGTIAAADSCHNLDLGACKQCSLVQ